MKTQLNGTPRAPRSGRASARIRAPRTLLYITLLAAAATARADWFDPAWSDRVVLTVNPAMIHGGGPFTDIPLAVMMDASHFAQLFAAAQSDGADLRVTGADGVTPWDFELVSYDPLAQTAELWVRAPLLSASEKVFHVYFGNPDPLLELPAGEAFTPSHLAVYHFDEVPGGGSAPDSSPNDAFAVEGEGSIWGPGDQVAGQLGRARNFDGTTDWLYTTNVSSPDSSFTISAWYANGDVVLDGSTALQSDGGFWNLSFQRNGEYAYPTLEQSNAFIIWEPELPDTQLHHYAWVLDGDNDVARFYFDGVEQAVTISYAPLPPHVPYTGASLAGRVGIGGPEYYNPYDLSDGVIDEFRIYEGVLSGDRIRTEYDNQSDQASFYSCTFEKFGSPTPTDPASAALAFGNVTVWPNPFQGRAQIDVEMGSSVLDVSIYDLAGRHVRTLRTGPGLDLRFQLQWDGRDDRGEAVGGGVYFVRAQSEHGRVGAKLLLVK